MIKKTLFLLLYCSTPALAQQNIYLPVVADVTGKVIGTPISTNASFSYISIRAPSDAVLVFQASPDSGVMLMDSAQFFHKATNCSDSRYIYVGSFASNVKNTVFYPETPFKSYQCNAIETIDLSGKRCTKTSGTVFAGLAASINFLTLTKNAKPPLFIKMVPVTETPAR